MSTAAVHSVHIYNEHKDLISRLCGIVTSGLKVGGAVLIVATENHRNQLVQALADAGVNMREHARNASFVMYDAEETLARFMVAGRPNPDLFTQSVGGLLKNAKANARGRDSGLTVFGEMVAVLWERGEKEAALELEALWNEALNDEAFHLHCAYPRGGVVGDSDEAYLTQVCHAHSHVVQ